VNYVNDGPITFTGLHVHYPGAAGINAPVVIDSGIGVEANSLNSPTGSGNITRVVSIDPTNSMQLAALSSLITAPDNAYVDIHTTVFAGGVARSQILPVVNVFPQGLFFTLTLSNPSATTAVQGSVSYFQSNGTPMPGTITDANPRFLILPAGSTIVTPPATAFRGGFARVYSNGPVNIGALFTDRPTPAISVTSRSVSVPVSVGATPAGNTGVAIVASSVGTLTLSLRLSTGTVIAGGSRTIDVAASQQISLFVTELLPGITQRQFDGMLIITTNAGTISVVALQYEGRFLGQAETVRPVTITALP
jgi:hypothetical protein